MNVSTPSSSSSIAARGATPARGRAVPPALRPLASFGGAILLGSALLHWMPTTRPATSRDAPVISPLMIISRSQMLAAHLAPLAPRTLRGQFQLTTDVTGRAPVGGEVARQLVEVGAHVEAGDRVLEVSSGAASRPSSPMERQQNQAEREQQDASRGQSALAQQLSIAQTQLGAAQERVAQAQQKVASTRALVKRLLAGEQIPATGDVSSPPRKRAHRKRERIAPTETPATRDAARDEAVLSDTQSALEAARGDQNDAHSALSVAQKKATASKAALERAQSDFKAEKTTIDVLQGARSDADDAASALTVTQSRADAADKTFTAKQAKEQEAQNAAKQSRQAARVAKTQGEETPPPHPNETAALKTEGQFLTPDHAVALAAAALAESKAATRAADRMRAKVEEYQRSVASTSQQADSASKDLQSAQQQVLDTAPRPVFTSARAPKSGIITWVSRLAREVSAGQPVFGLSQGSSKATLQFDDKSSAWKSLKVGQILQAAIEKAGDIATEDTEKLTKKHGEKSNGNSSLSLSVSSSASSVAMKRSTAAAPTAAPPEARVFSIRLTRIEPPQGEEAAHIEAVRVEESAATEEADTVQVELPAQALPQNPSDAGTPATPARPVVVPASVILPREGVNYVAVMMPTKAAPSSSPSTSPQTRTISWRPVQIARQTAFDVELRAGMRDGEKVVDQPALLLSQWKPEDGKPLLVSLDFKD